jgi:hypothetical protein
MHDILAPLFSWIPGQHAPAVAHGLSIASNLSPTFLLACAPLALLCLLSISTRWARLNDSPWVFALTHSLPFFALTFLDSLGDAGQVTDGVRSRYHMSEPLATWVHYWFFRLLHEPFNIGAKDAIAWSSRVGGVVYTFLVAHVSWHLFPELTPSRRLLHRLLFLTAGVSFLFYGYIENPPLALPAEQLWILTSLMFLAVPRPRNVVLCSAALALATAIHGRAGFLFPALALGLVIPTGSILARLMRLTLGCSIFFGLLGALVAYIFYVEPHFISGGPHGNVTGGGNRQMFVHPEHLFTRAHIEQYLRPLLIAGGCLLPLGVLKCFSLWYKPSRLDIWCLGYVVADLVYLLLWEFDYGPYIDWDLVFSAAIPLILLTSRVIVPSRVPTACVVPFLLVSVFISNTFAVMANNAPLASILPPTATPSAATTPCAIKGLRRTYYKGQTLSVPVGIPEADVPYHAYGPGGIALPQADERVGGVFDGQIEIPEPGRYRFFIIGQRNVRMRIGGHLIVDRWINYEWRVTAEREIRFPVAGRYPITIEFYSETTGFPLMLEIESGRYPRRKIEIGELCHD